MAVPQFKEIRRSYGFDEVAIVPGQVTINPEQADMSMSIGDLKFDIPIMASAMDAIVSPSFAIQMGKKGGIAVLNLEGLWTRYQDAEDKLAEVAETPLEQATALLQSLYTAPIQEELVAQRVHEIKAGDVKCAVAVTPQRAKRFAPIAVEAGADMLVVQSTVTTAKHISKSYHGLVFSELVEQIKIPVVVGNCVGYDVALELMENGIQGLLVGIGPGAACTSREVVGIGVPQVTATMDCAAAREEYLHRTGKYVSVITDGGIRTGGDVCKSFVAGADGVMLGTPFAQAIEAPGKGHNWGMANPHPALPRGTRVDVGVKGTLKQIFFGPTSRTDGTQNLIGALRVCMGMIGASTIQEMHNAEMVVAPSIKTEGKHFQLGLE
ncbi:MAG: GuaB3 family IMP dehydrogenase-related protein [Chloroflexi bacterium]|nr:GuaB3 family IMP dehydrogenase-related protein [Chloroflexota bacterium]